MVVATNPAAEPPRKARAELSARDAEILAFERQWWKFAGAKEQAIRDKFQMSATRYYQVLNALIDKPGGAGPDPLLVKRLRRLRATRSARAEERNSTSAPRWRSASPVRMASSIRQHCCS